MADQTSSADGTRASFPVGIAGDDLRREERALPAASRRRGRPTPT